MIQKIVWLLPLFIVSTTWSYPHFYRNNPAFEYLYQSPYLIPSSSFYNNEFIPKLHTSSPTVNIEAELPFILSKEYSVVPMFLVPKDNLNMGYSHQAEIQQTAQNPSMILNLKNSNSGEITPSVKILLEKPILTGSLKTDVFFPAEMQLIHQGAKIPFKVGAIIAPILPQTYVSEENPIAIQVIYAVPSKPIKITITIESEEINKKPPVNPSSEIEEESVVVENETNKLPPKNITIMDFPQTEDVPHLIHLPNNEDDELVNRNPPIVPVQLAPAGIVQSTQPISHTELFHNDKESPILEELRNPNNKKKKL